MAIALRGAAWVPSTQPTTGFTCTIDSNVVAGDYLIMAVTSRDSIAGSPDTTCVDDDTGGNTWTLIANEATKKAWIFGKRATSGTASKTITIANCLDSAAGVGKAFSGVSSGATPYANISPETNASADELHAGITPTYRNCMILAIVCIRDNNNAVTSLSFATLGATTMTEKISSGGQDSYTAFGHALQTGGPTATGDLTWSMTDLTSYTYVLALIPNETLTTTAPTVTFTAPTATLTMGVGGEVSMADLSTKFAAYLRTVYDAGVGVTANTRTDMTTLFTKDIPTVRGHASVDGQVDDANTMYGLYTP